MCPGPPRHLGPTRGIGEERAHTVSQTLPRDVTEQRDGGPGLLQVAGVVRCSFPAEVASGMNTAGLPRAVSSARVPAPLRDTTTSASARTSGSSGPTNLDPRTFRQPGGDRARFTIRQQVNRPAGLNVDQTVL
ncbi:hypothetical protein ADL34_25540 [Streptomyces sp. NRRL WC-3605]|nr:hypothetical protein ADL34_25540 [Streptomyces sp. NRRL WC-3605]KUL71558.1 hypothetical protein ADL33_25390 [Streptomyces sp. NRRL WC-3604]